MVGHTARAGGSVGRYCDFGRCCHVLIGGPHQPVCTSICAAKALFEIDSILSLTCRSPLGKLAPGNAEIDKVFKDMWVEAEKNRTKWSCESQHPSRFYFIACIPQSILTYLASTQISGEPTPCSIFRMVKGLPPSGFRIGRMSRAFRNLQLHLLAVEGFDQTGTPRISQREREKTENRYQRTFPIEA